MENTKALYRPLLGQAQGARKLHVHLTELNGADGWQGQHAHAAEEAIYILEGEAEFTFGGRTYRVGPGEMVLFPSNVMHAEARFFSDKMKYLVIRTVEPGDEPCCCEGEVPSQP